MLNRLFLRSAASGSLILGLLTITAFAKSNAPAPVSPTEMLANRFSSMGPISLAGISIGNFGVVDGRIFRGEQPSGKDYAALAGICVKTIIDLREDAKSSARRDAESAGFKYINIQIDGHGRPTDEQANEFLNAVDDPGNGILYVHCAGGRHRTGSMIAIYRMTHDEWTIDQAYNEMLAYDFYTSGGHEGFKSYVYDFSRHLNLAPKLAIASVASASK